MPEFDIRQRAEIQALIEHALGKYGLLPKTPVVVAPTTKTVVSTTYIPMELVGTKNGVNRVFKVTRGLDLVNGRPMGDLRLNANPLSYVATTATEGNFEWSIAGPLITVGIAPQSSDFLGFIIVAVKP